MRITRQGGGSIVYTCTNGDKIYATFEAQGVRGGKSNAVSKIVGGTGSCAGIEGTLEVENTPGIKLQASLSKIINILLYIHFITYYTIVNILSKEKTMGEAKGGPVFQVECIQL